MNISPTPAQRVLRYLIVMLSFLPGITPVFAQPGSMLNNTDCNGSYSNKSMTTVGQGSNNTVFRYREQANATTGAGAKFYQFNTDNYFNTWNLNIPTYNTVQTAIWCGGCGYNSGIRMGPTTAGNYYTFNLRKGTSYTNQSMAILQTSFQPRDISSYTTPSNVQPNQPASMSVALNGNVATGEYVYVAYSTDNFATAGNSGIASFVTNPSAGSYTFSIPGFAAGTTVTFYPFTSVSAAAPSYSDAPILVLNMRNGTNQNTTNAYSTYQVCTPASAPTVDATNMNFTNVGPNQTRVNFTAGNGARRIVIAKAGSAITGTPSNYSSFADNPVFGSGATIASGEYVVYNGTGNSVNVTGLTANTTYYYAVFEFNGTGCPSAGQTYKTTTPLTGSQMTTATGTTNKPIVIDGAYADWASTDQIGVDGNNNKVYATWDEQYIYIRFEGGFNLSDDRLNVAIDTDPGTNSGFLTGPFSGALFAGYLTPEYVVQSTSNTNLQIYPRSGGSWGGGTDIYAGGNALYRTAGDAEFRIPRTNIGSPNISNPIGIICWLSNSSDNIYTSFAPGNPNGNGTMYVTTVFNSSGSGINPSTDKKFDYNSHETGHSISPNGTTIRNLYVSSNTATTNATASTFNNVVVGGSTVSLTLGSATIINGTLTLTSSGTGSLVASGQSLTFQNADVPIVQSSGGITTNTSTNLSFGSVGNTGGATITIPANSFTASPVPLASLTLNRTNGLALNAQSLAISSNLSIVAGTINLGSITTHTAGTLILGGLGRINGSWGSTASGATFKNDTYFNVAGSGIITVSNDNRAIPTATLIVTNTPQPYSGSSQSATVGVSSSSVPGTVTSISTGGAATQTNAGTYAVTADFVPTDGTSYKTLTAVSAGNFVIDKIAPTLSVTNTPQNYTGSPIAAVVTGTGGGVVSNILYNGSATVPTNAGTYAVTADIAASANYTSGTGLSAGNFVISPIAPTLTVTNSPQNYTGSPIAAVVTGTGGGVVSNVLYDGSATVPTNAGTYAITADIAASANYTSGTGLSAGNFVISPIAPTLTVTNSPQNYTGSPIAAVVTGTGGGAVSNILYNGSATVPTNAGTYAITADIAASANHDAGIGLSAGNFVISKIAPTLTVTNSPQAFTGSPIAAVVTGTGGGVVSNILYNGSATVPTIAGTYAITADIAASTNYNAGTGLSAGNFVITPPGCTPGNWIGTTGNWSNAANWSCTTLPTSGTAITISAGSPVLDVDFTVANSLVLSGSGGLTIAPNKTLTISGSANFGGRPVTVQSSAAGTGAIGSITGSLSGASNVTVERYIPNSGRKWRLLSIPVASVSPRQAFADGKAPNGSAPAGETGGYGTLITGPYANSAATATGNGFDWWAALNNPAATASIRQYTNTGATGNYNTVPNVTAPAGEQGYLLFVRGDRTVVNGSSATTLRATGQLKTGLQTVAVDVTKSHTVAGNPYAAPIDFQLVYNSNSSLIKEQCWIWDATLGGVGGYRLVKKTGGNWYGIPFNYTGSGTQDNYNRIQSGQAFFVEPAPLASSGNMNIVESHKSIGSAPNVFDAPTGTGFLFANLNQDNGSSQVLTDGAAATFGSGYQQATTDLDDVRKVSNFGENFGIVRDAVQLSLEARPQISDKDTVFFSMSGTTVRNYNLQFKAVNLQAGLTARLEDKFTGKSETIGTNDGDITTYAFSVTSVAGSAAADRFRIVFKADQTLPLTLNSARAYQQGSSAVQVDWKATNERNLRSYEVEKSLDGRSFTKASTVAAKNSSEASYSWLDATATKGLNYYRIKAISNDGTSSYSQVLLVNIGNEHPGFAVYPNPVKGGVISLQLNAMKKGQYSLSVYNAQGQRVMTRQIEHLGGSATQTLSLDNLAAGVYKLSLGEGLEQSIIVLN